MARWPQFPTLYEINTWVWLAKLSASYGRRVELRSVPAAEWDRVAKLGFDGVCERCPERSYFIKGNLKGAE